MATKTTSNKAEKVLTTEVKPAKMVTPKVEKPAKTTEFSITTYSLLGKESGSLELPKTVFEGKINKALLSQAIRVYSNNEKGHYSNTKTRGEVVGSTRKIYNQKGTGRARHGSVMAPIFVGGGIALGPKVRIVTLELPKKMRKGALIAAMRSKLASKELMGLEDLSKVTGKTSEFSKFLKTMQKKTALMVLGNAEEMVIRATKNLKGLSVTTVSEMNVFEVIRHQGIFMTAAAVAKLEERLGVDKTGEEKTGASTK